jgi:1-aminocyclopropane-1-carboxylate deaminase/D-cysteine desulfhydrase-like pyridoxal-dependent ACC family enzyme
MAREAIDRRALEVLDALPCVPLGHYPTPVEEMSRLQAALGGGPRLLVKRDDAISFGFGGNKVRKLELVAARARAQGADTLITTGGVQSNHARATAAAAARLGLRCIIVANGRAPERLTGNALLDGLLGAELDYVATREERAPRMQTIAADLAARGRRPYLIPLGASTPLGALGFVKAIGELVRQGVRPDVIVHATSSGGTQAGLVAGCVLHGLPTRVLGVSADDPAATVVATVRQILAGVQEHLPVDAAALAVARPIEVEDGFVGEGYGIPSDASREAQQLAALLEAIFVDHTYTAKALAGLIAGVRSGRFRRSGTVLFWHTGGQVGLFA